MDIATYVLIGSSIYLALIISVFLFQEKFIFQGHHVRRDYQYRFDFDYEEIYLNPDSKALLHGMLLKSEEARGVVLYFHGNRGDLRKWAPICHPLTRHGFDVFVIDYRGYGKSRGARSEKVLHDDASFVYDYLNERYGNNIVIYGRSLGSGIAVKLASERPARFLILETPFYSLLDIAGMYFTLLPMKWLTRYEFRSHMYLDRVTSSVLVFHGTRDRIVPIASALKLVDASNKARVNFMKIAGGKHNNLDTFEVYQSELHRVFSNITREVESN